MENLGPILSLVFVVIVARLLLRKYYPHAVLIVAGLAMMVLSYFIVSQPAAIPNATGSKFFDLFQLIQNAFSKINAEVGLMIMAIGGFVAYMEHIGASDALVKIALKPLGLLKNYPQLTAVCVIPIGQLLFVCIPSAAGLSLLLMTSVFPILVNLGVSRITAVSVITACTAFGIGPASALTASATEIAEVDAVAYFLSQQLPLVIPSSLFMMLVYFFTNRYFDRKLMAENGPDAVEAKEKVFKDAPTFYALIPVLPLILLIVFSEILHLFPTPIILDTTTAMFCSLFVALAFEAVRLRSLRKVLDSLKIFWAGMSDIFKTVVTLIIAAEIFSKGLIALGFIDGLVRITEHLGFSAIGVGVVLTLMIFLASMLMGSGNAAFFAFGPLIPKIALKLGVPSSTILLPMNLSASMGRTVSPVAGLIIACSEIAGVSSFDIVKRNLIPLSASFIFLLILHFIS